MLPLFCAVQIVNVSYNQAYMAKILLLIAQDGFQTKEYHDPKEVLSAEGHTVVTGSNTTADAVSNIGETAKVDIALSDVDPNGYDGIFIVGGPGALKYLDNPETIRIMKGAKEGGKLFGAICISPRILAKGGMLSGVRVTGWNGDEKLEAILSEHGATYEPLPVVRDGLIITADGPMSARAFGEEIARAYR
jgi:protease I